jgi:PAS domain S-box-containing protein
MSGETRQDRTATLGTHAGDDWDRTFNAVPDLIAILDTRHRIVRVNRAQANRIGLTPEECVGLSSCRMFHGSDEPLPDCPYRRLLEDGREHSAELHDERTGCDYLVTAAPLTSDSGELTGCVHVAREITARKRAEEALQQTVSLLRATLDSTADGILVVDARGRIVDFNAQFVNLWRIPRELLERRNDDEALQYVLHQLKFPDLFVAKVRELYASPEADSFDLLEFIDGRVFERYSRPQRLGGRPVGRVWSFRDVTDRKQAEDTLLRQMAFDAMATKFLSRAARGDATEVDNYIRTSLEELGFFAEVDETYVALFGEKTWGVSHWWHHANGPGKIQGYRDLAYGVSPWIEARLLEGKSVQLHTLEDLPREAREERERLARDGVVSLLLVPLRGKSGVVRGSCGLRSYSRSIRWAPEDVQRMRLLGDAIAAALERRRAENARSESEIRMRTILESVQTGIVIADPATGDIVDLNSAAATLIGLPREQILGESTRRFLRDDLDGEGAAQAGKHVPGDSETALVRADGTRVPVLKKIVPLELNGRRHILETVVDVSALKQMEERVAQAEKMDAIGRLAGGVAHDFNNIVQVILGFTEIVLMSLPADHPRRQDVLEIKGAAARGGDIARQLLAFSRRQAVSPTVLDLNAAVNDNLKMLRCLLGEDIPIEAQLAPDLKHIYVDAGQIVQVIMNLAVNARDAMPHGGQLQVRTSNTTISPYDEEALRQPGAHPGEFVCLTVTDNGTGIPDHVRAHLFEPFFTTKEMGKGTGLGLSVVYGIVKQCEGWLRVDSRVGDGTTFHVYFPVYAERMDVTEVEATEQTVAPALRGNGECILVVEDDANVCQLGARVLQAAGYQVLACASAAEAAERFQSPDRTVDLLFSDVVLPDRSGIELADDFRLRSPDLPVLLCSGYTDERSRLTAINEKGYLFLQKPYSSSALLHIVRLLLNARQAGI